MRGKLLFIGGLATGFVLGARAGREKYEELVVKGRKVLDHPSVQEAAGVAQAQANRLYAEGKDRLSQTKLGEKLSTSDSDTTTQLTTADRAFAGTPAGTGTSGTSTSTASTTSSSTGTRPKTSGGGTGANGTTL
ncbi:hypothetical protein ACFFWC_10545 [Plantactinospora siamensis]|uniref:YtxH domain-containing protein n=1 Tax=Plantactinospora siamensis TaxID=555372 RepID=A0ABV6NW93_9ACTN